MKNEHEFNVIFRQFRKRGWATDCIFELHPKIADDIREHSCSYHKVLRYYLHDDNSYVFSVHSTDTEFLMPVVREIERISNEHDQEYFIDHLISDNGKFNHYHKVRELLEKDFGLEDKRVLHMVMVFFSDMHNLRFVW